MGNAKTEAKKRERDRLRGKRTDPLAWRVEAVRQELVKRAGNARRIGGVKLHEDGDGLVFQRIVLDERGKPVATFDTSIGRADVQSKSAEHCAEWIEERQLEEMANAAEDEKAPKRLRDACARELMALEDVAT